MQKTINQLLLAAAFLYCGAATAQTQINDATSKQKEFFHNFRAKTSLSARFNHTVSTKETKVLQKSETKKVPVSLVSVNWDQQTNAWTDTTEKYAISYADNGVPSQVILDIPDGDNGFPEKIIITDWYKIDEADDEGFAYIFNGENYMFKKALAKVYVAGMWVDYQRYTVNVNANNKIADELIEEKTDLNWSNSQKTTFTYNQQNLNTEILNQEWKNGAWVNSFKNNYTYDVNGVITEDISAEWDGNSWQTQYGSRYLNTYNSSNQVTSTERYIFNYDQKVWEPQNRQTYTLNAAGEITEAIEEMYSPGIEEWVKATMYSNIIWQNFDKTDYNSSPINVGGNEVISYERKYWAGDQWITNGREANQYNSAGFQTLSSFESYMDGTYKQVEKTETSYYSNNDVKEVKYYMFMSDTVLEHGSGYSYINTYDADGDKTDEIFRTWNDGQYVNLFRTLTTFSTITTGVEEETATSGINIYPNPAVNGTVTIALANKETSSIDVFDATGKNVLHTTANASANKVLDVSNFPKGLYFITISCNNVISKNRIVIQ